MVDDEHPYAHKETEITEVIGKGLLGKVQFSGASEYIVKHFSDPARISHCYIHGCFHYNSTGQDWVTSRALFTFPLPFSITICHSLAYWPLSFSPTRILYLLPALARRRNMDRRRILEIQPLPLSLPPRRPQERRGK